MSERKDTQPMFSQLAATAKSKIRQHKVYAAHDGAHGIAVGVGKQQTAGGAAIAYFFNYSTVFRCKSVAFKYLSHIFQSFLLFHMLMFLFLSIQV